jgi:apolipoprotein N-acyltransferase
MAHGRRTLWMACGAALLVAGAWLPDVARVSAWLSLAFLLRGWRGLPARAALARLAPLLYGATLATAFGTIPVQGPLYFLIVATLTPFLLAPFVAERALGRFVSGPAETLVFPAALVAAEFLRSRLPHGPGTWYALGYSQYGDLSLMQLAALTGIWGISFLIGWFASSLNWALERRFEWPAVRMLVLALAGTFGAVWLWGGLRLGAPETPALRVAAVSFPPDVLSYGEMFRLADGRLPVDAVVAGKLERLHAWFFDSTEREARAGARLVAWPEMNFLVLEKDEVAEIERAKRLAVRERIHLSMGIGTVLASGPRRFQNKAVLVEPSGAVRYSYLKSHPALGWEEGVMQRGDGRLPVAATGVGRVSTAICFDGDDPALVRQAGRGGADLLILPANDWPAIKRIHFEMAAFRAIENGVPLLRAASFGISGVFDAYGRVRGTTDHLAGGGPALIAEVPVGGVPTRYSRVGDLFAWLCLAATAAFGVRALAYSLLLRSSSSSSFRRSSLRVWTSVTRTASR